MSLYTAIFWDQNEKALKRYRGMLAWVLEKEKELESFTLKDVKEKTKEFMSLFDWIDYFTEEGKKEADKILESIKSEAFALVKQTCKLLNWKEFDLESWKTIEWNMVPYDVQIIWWLALHEWNISEMRTGEWKTLVATFPTYLNALTWNTVHIVTVNDYLAARDAEEMGVLYNALWLTVWVVTHMQPRHEKKEAYNNNVIYATNNELWFDYLRDNMLIKKEDKSQGKLFYAIIDEVDSILIDEARTPLIISAPEQEATTKYAHFAQMSKKLVEDIDYKLDEKAKAAVLTEEWISNIEKMLKVENIYVSNHYNDIHHIENALKAKAVFKKDRDYIIKNDEVLIVDEFTWRVLPWRRYSDGLHQALEAKENVKIQQESRTLASVTFQNYFRLYSKLSWMTWTAKTEEEEFYKVYWLDVIVIPTNRPLVRDDRADLLFKNEAWKFMYLVNLIKEHHEEEQPVLVWTVSVDKSELLSKMLKKEKIPHKVLNAKHHEKEAEIVANAWAKWAVTIATNMAGRWTDIKLWEWVSDVWGLVIIWTEKHEARRIDNQLRGRAWRQWDPWISQFLISPNDDIMRIFGGDKLFSIFNSPMFNAIPDEEPLTESKMLTRKITSVQKQVEWRNFDIRKHLLEYDDVINQHRLIIYARRDKILDAENIHENVSEMITSQLRKVILVNLIWDKSYEWDMDGLQSKINDFLSMEVIDEKWKNEINKFIEKKEIVGYIFDIAMKKFEEITNGFKDNEDFYSLERNIVLQSIDELWMRHIDAMSKLREAVAFEGYAQKNPLIVYKEKAYDKFLTLLDELEYKVTKAIFTVDPNTVVNVSGVNTDNLELNEEEVEKLLKNFNQSQQKAQAPSKPTWKYANNPLFNAPATPSESNNDDDDDTPKVIRV